MVEVPQVAPLRGIAIVSGGFSQSPPKNSSSLIEVQIRSRLTAAATFQCRKVEDTTEQFLPNAEVGEGSLADADDETVQPL